MRVLMLAMLLAGCAAVDAQEAACPEMTAEQRLRLIADLNRARTEIDASVPRLCKSLLEPRYYDEDRADCETMLEALAGIGEVAGKIESWLESARPVSGSGRDAATASEIDGVWDSAQLERAATWVDVRSWKGESAFYTSETESFAVPNEWRVIWSIRGPHASHISMAVHGVSEADRYHATMAGEGPSTDTAYVRGAGRFYLNITAVGVWSVTVQAPKVGSE